MEWVVFVVVAVGAAVVIVASRRQKARDAANREFAWKFWFCSLNEFESLISSGADVNGVIQGYKPGNWHRPLHTLATRGEDRLTLKKIESLLRSGADVNGLDSQDRTPLVCLVESGGDWGKTASLLISHGAKSDHVNRRGATLLHTAAGTGRYSVVKALLDAGANMSARAPLTSIFIRYGSSVGTDSLGRESHTTQGALAIHFAATNASVDVARVLLRRGADANARTDDGVTPLAIIEARRASYQSKVADGDTYRTGYMESLEAFETLLAQARRI